MFIGYARVSTEEQSLDLQIDALTSAGCSQVFTDKVSGAAAQRPGLGAALSYLRAGDVLVVWKLDRLGRTVKGLVQLIEELHSRGVQFRSITDSIDTSTTAGKFFFHVIAAMSEMERELIRERTRAGLKAARARGRLGGRKTVMTTSKLESAKKLLESGMVAQEVADNLGVSRATLFRHLAQNSSKRDAK